jgi:hypothetical protein
MKAHGQVFRRRPSAFIVYILTHKLLYSEQKYYFAVNKLLESGNKYRLEKNTALKKILCWTL